MHRAFPADADDATICACFWAEIALGLLHFQASKDWAFGGHEMTWESGTRVPILSALADTLDILRRRADDMVARNFVGADKFYHCVAVCEASSRGAVDASFSATAGVARERYQQYGKGEPADCSNLMPAGFTCP